jgi:hypothetical protein|uniref:Uncharacterized protein n=1 Tax=Siphoviridae sp. ctQqU1 TaxID=2825496 RepID=A0A8S5Q518_9CAUD|nr:MAG TPA: hypothetical protein [Siphoviridae sp. ctQqU1]
MNFYCTTEYCFCMGIKQFSAGKAISALGDDVDDSDYWRATEGNAKRALCGLLAFAKMRPDGVWDGD